MEPYYKFSVLQFQAHPIRRERLNLALVVFKNNALDIRITRRLDKIRAISSAIDVEYIKLSIERLISIDQDQLEAGASGANERLSALRMLSSFCFSDLGELDAAEARYEELLCKLVQRLVDPEPAPPQWQKRPTRLLRIIKSALKAEHILARKDEGLDCHRVVSGYQVADGLTVDLLLKNGAMHVFEAVDASLEDQALQRVISNVAVSSLVFAQAKVNFGPEDTKTKLVYTAGSSVEQAMLPSLRIVEAQGANLVNWNSADDQRSFLAYVSSLATPLPVKRKGNTKFVHANHSPRLLN